MKRDIHAAYVSLSERVQGFGCAFLPQPHEPEDFLRVSVYEPSTDEFDVPFEWEGFPVRVSFGSFMEQP